MPDLEHRILNQQEAVWGVQDQQNPACPLTDTNLPRTEPSQQRESSLQRETKPEVKPLPTIPVMESVEEEPVVVPLPEAPSCVHSSPLQKEPRPVEPCCPERTQDVPLQEVAPPKAVTPVPLKPAPKHPAPSHPVTHSQTRGI